MTQQYKKIRPTRAARAREKTRTPNIPEFTGPDDWDRPAAPAAPAERPAPAFGAGANALASGPRPAAATAFARAARNTSLEITQDYTYLRDDLIRITWTSTVLVVGMIALAFVWQ